MPCAERHQPLHRAGITADSATPRRIRVAEALDAAPGVRVCAVCSRAAHGFYYTHELRPDRYPTFAFCSRRCQCAGAAIAKRKNGMIDKTDMETARDQGRPPVPRRGADRARTVGAIPRPHRRRDRPHHRGVRRWIPGLDATSVAQRRHSILGDADDRPQFGIRIRVWWPDVERHDQPAHQRADRQRVSRAAPPAASA